MQVNGHNVLQSSEKVVKTLLDARTSLEIVIARRKPSKAADVSKLNNQSETATVLAGSGSKSNNGDVTRADDSVPRHHSPSLVFDDVLNIQEARSSGVKVVTQSERSKRYEQACNAQVSPASACNGPTFVL